MGGAVPETSYLGLGSNLGDRAANIRKALSLLAVETTLTRVSSLYETEPWGHEAQPRFLNAACRVETMMPPLELLGLLQCIEKEVGRQPTFPLGPRVIDVDILLYGQESVETVEVVVPHAGLAERAFVLVPLAEIAREVRHPVLGVSIGQLLESVSGKEKVRWWGPAPDLIRELRKARAPGQDRRSGGSRLGMES